MSIIKDNLVFKTGTVKNGTPSTKLSPINILLQKLQNVNTKYSLTAMDDEYISAVESGDMKKAQRLVDNAADIGNGAELLKLYVEELNDVNSENNLRRAYQL